MTNTDRRSVLRLGMFGVLAAALPTSFWVRQKPRLYRYEDVRVYFRGMEIKGVAVMPFTVFNYKVSQ